MDGIPGTGKSYYIRGLIAESNALFVFIPASLSGTMTGPEIVPVLLQYRDEPVPIVLIMEDADANLVTRQIDNVSKLSELLNMSDGLFGDLADIRIIATTNAKKPDIDEAVLRPGRLMHHLTFSPLCSDMTKEIYTRLVEKDIEDLKENTQYTLAEVYKMARQEGWRPAVKKNTARRQGPPADIGFGRY